MNFKFVNSFQEKLICSTFEINQIIKNPNGGHSQGYNSGHSAPAMIVKVIKEQPNFGGYSGRSSGWSAPSFGGWN